jgi:probable rRNA maturation factor
MSASIIISVAEGRWQNALPELDALTRAAIGKTLECAAPALPDKKIEVGVTFTNDNAMRALNSKWRGKDKPTNVLSFPAANADGLPADAPLLLGDILLGFETVLQEAGAAEKSLNDHALHLLIHGTLHLLGHDHEAETDAKAMESLEIKILSGFNVPNPYILMHET